MSSDETISLRRATSDVTPERTNEIMLSYQFTHDKKNLRFTDLLRSLDAKKSQGPDPELSSTQDADPVIETDTKPLSVCRGYVEVISHISTISTSSSRALVHAHLAGEQKAIIELIQDCKQMEVHQRTKCLGTLRNHAA